MKKTIFLIAIATFAFFSFIDAQTTVPGGPVIGTWTESGSPYLITGDIGVDVGQTLIIEPGVEVEFQDHYKFSVIGSLIAIGHPTNMIWFGVEDTTGFSNMNTTDGGWHGLRFGPSVDSSRIRYCIFHYGKAVGSQYIDKVGGAIRVHQYDDLTILNSYFLANAAVENGGAIGISDADIVLHNNEFFHNHAGNGGAIAVTGSDVSIQRSYFVDNHASNSGGGVSMTTNSNGDITSNLFAGNFGVYGGGLFAGSNSSPILQNNLFYSNVAYQEGGGIDLEINCQSLLINNTIVGNFANFGGGLDVEVNTNPEVRNTIFWDNTGWVDGSQIHLFSEDSDPDFYYCDIEGGVNAIGLWYGGSTYSTYTGTYQNNIDLDPDFYDMGNVRYLLDDGSPCIDAGDPDNQYNDLEDPGSPGFAKWPSKGTIRNDMGVYGGLYPLDSAFYLLTEYEITLIADPAEGGTTDGEGFYTYLAQVTVTANPNAGYVFINWTDEEGDTVSINQTFSFLMPPWDGSFTAHFDAFYSLTLSAIPGDGGLVDGAGDYPPGTVVDISATPETGWVFNNWTGDVADTTSSNTTVIMDSHKTANAFFYLLGDANADGDVNVLDLVTMANRIMGQNPDPFIFRAADVNFDDEINVLDIVGVANIIMGGN